jgi:lysyl-tRNA synthetase class 2
MMPEDWRPSASLEVLRSRAGMLERIRAYFAAQEVHEVQTPALSAAAVSDPAIESVAAEAAQGMQSWLQTSPEYPMKRLLAAGFGDCYQVCPVFRAGESGRLHNPEFTLIEWYRLEFGVGEMEHDVDRLLRVACAELRSFAPARAVAYRAAMLEGSGVDCTSAQVPEIRAALAARGIEPAQSSGRWDRDEWLDLLMGAVVGPGLGHDAPVFVHDYPPAQASLARLRAGPDGTQVAERFELYVDGLELANGFRELGDSGEQRRRFEQDQATRRRRGQPLRPLDERLLAALAAGLPDCAGVALGFDRLVMAALRLPSLDAAMAFPFARA